MVSTIFHKCINVVINVFFIFSIMLDACNDPLYSILCWHNHKIIQNLVDKPPAHYAQFFTYYAYE